MLRRRLALVWLATLALNPLAFGQQAAREPFDVLIRGGKIVDGTGNPWFQGDVAIRGDRIAAMGSLGPDATARRIIDARGMVVAPGFHRHAFSF